MKEQNSIKEDSILDQLLENPVLPSKKSKKVVENTKDLLNLIQVTFEVKNKYKLNSSLSK